VVGGRATYAHTIDNYTGFPEGISGNELPWEGLHQEEPSDLVAVGKESTAGINASAFVKV
jgi:thioredoxin reductase